MTSQPQRLWDRMSVYMPVLLMGVLALGSWWLVRSAPSISSGVADVPRGHEPDYFMEVFSVKNFGGSGAMLSEVRGTVGRHFPDTDTLEVEGMRMHSVDAKGHQTRATADRALSNADGTDVQLFGNARVVREPFQSDPSGKKPDPQLTFAGEFLHVWPQQERVESNQPVTLTRGADTFKADGLVYDNARQVLELKGNVKGSLIAQKAK